MKNYQINWGVGKPTAVPATVVRPGGLVDVWYAALSLKSHSSPYPISTNGVLVEYKSYQEAMDAASQFVDSFKKRNG